LLRGQGNLNLETGAGEDSILEQGYTLAWTGWQEKWLGKTEHVG
jgi:hypothetical protein